MIRSLALLVVLACSGKRAPERLDVTPSTRVADVQLAHGCYGLVERDLVATPCPPPPPAGTREIAVWVQRDKLQVGLTVADEVNEIGDRKLLADVLRNQHRAAAFEGRTDLAIAVAPDLTVADVVEVLQIARAAGFATARWVEPAALPMPLATR